VLLAAGEEGGGAGLGVGVGAADSDDLNRQDRRAWLGASARETEVEQEISLRLLRHLASSVRHQQFHDVDILTLRVSAVPERGS